MTQSTPEPQDPTAQDGPGDLAGTAPQPDGADAGPGQIPHDGTAGQPTDGAPARTAEKDPSEWATGGEPATGPQLSYLSTLAQEASIEVPENITKADASKLIDELQNTTGRGKPAGS